jgi:23S rRNA (uracil1939-C5)-methyltransferase
MDNKKKQRIVEVCINSFSKGGHGIGYTELPNGSNTCVEVPFTIPGDLAKAILLPKRKGIHASLLQEILIPSPDRIAPRCIHFASCGGCRWQQISYEQQLEQKESFVRQCFLPHLSDDVIFHPILACDPPWQYRNKMEFSFSNNKAKDRFLGLVMQGSKGKVINLTECHLTHPWFIETVEAVRGWWGASNLDAYHPFTNTGSLRTLMLREGRRTGDRMVMLTVSGNADFALNKHQLESFTATLRHAIEPASSDQKLSIFLRIQQIAKGSPTNFYEMLLYGPDHIREVLSIEGGRPLTFQISPAAFFQPNTQQAEQLYSEALRLANIPKGGVIYDLYCGTGTLGICAAHFAKEVIGIEITPESVLDARANAELNGIDNYTVHEGDVGKVLQRLKDENNLPQADLVMVDPPRSGLDANALNQLVDLNPEKILYISCNPLTQSANIGALIEKGYRLIKVQPVDQFPQTIHIENIAVLTK